MEKYLYKDLYDLEQKHWWHIAKRKTIYSLIKSFINSKKINIVDIGCGTGGNLEAFSKLGSVYGVDKSKLAVNFCHKRGFKKVKVGSSEKTGLKNSFFNVVTLLDVLEHVEEEKTLKEMKRILKRNGYLIITVPAFSFLWSKWDEVLHHKRRYTTDRLSQLLKDNNFQVVKITYLYSFLVIPVLLIRTFKQLINKKEYSSDFKISNFFINKIMEVLTDKERNFAFKNGLPFGTSIICLAKVNK